MADSPEFAGNVARFSGFADLYDNYRASPPATLAVMVARYTGTLRPACVVDLGSGTGLSTRYWADRAGCVVGVEPSADMRRRAEAATTAANVSYQPGFAHATGLPTGCAQVVCCMQALHWMEPTATFTEVARLLPPGGVFAACDYDWPPRTPSPEANAAFAACIRIGRRLEQKHGLASPLQFWDKAGHTDRMRASGRFRQVIETAVPHHDTGNAARLVGLVLSQGYIQALLKRGCTERELAIDVLKEAADRVLGVTQHPFAWTARVRLGLT